MSEYTYIKSKRYIYFFFKRGTGDVLYIGQTNNVKTRLTDHKIHKKEMVTEASGMFYFPIYEKDADVVESTFILLFEPPYNGTPKKNYRMTKINNLIISKICNEYDSLGQILQIPQGHILFKDDGDNWEETYLDIFNYDNL